MMFALVATVAAVGWCAACRGDEESAKTNSPGGETIVFARDVQPILQRRCIACHGPEKQQGKLRLDARKFAAQGGESGISLLQGGVDDNELLRRVISHEEGYRMPLEGPTLADNEIAALRSWVAQGANWPEEKELATGSVDSSKNAQSRWVDYSQAESLLQRLGYAPYGLLAALLVGLVVLRVRGRMTAPGSQPQSAAARRFCAWTGPSVQLAVLFAFVVWGLLAYARSLHADLQDANQRLAALGASSGEGVASQTLPEAYFPRRPENSISATYYRGNDERSPHLFNGGFYRTATFELNVCNSQKQPLEIGSPVGDGPLYLRLEIQRSPGATQTLFTPAIIKKILLSPVPTGRHVPHLADEVVHVQTLQEDESWVGYWPIELPSDKTNTTVSGTFYICKGDITDDIIVGTLHYNVQYDLAIADGKLQPDSNVEMGSLYRVGNLQVAMPNMIQQNEWFDNRPIPVITGENSTDPKLLGVEEHLGTDVEPAEDYGRK